MTRLPARSCTDTVSGLSSITVNGTPSALSLSANTRPTGPNPAMMTCPRSGGSSVEFARPWRIKGLIGQALIAGAIDAAALFIIGVSRRLSTVMVIPRESTVGEMTPVAWATVSTTRLNSPA